MKARAPFHLLIKPIGPVCNLDCEYCFYLKKTGLYPDEKSFRMTDKTLDLLTRQYIESQPGGTAEVSFGWQGGEPTLMGLEFYHKALKLQAKYARPGMRAANSLQTNGVLIDEEWAKFLHDEQFLVGLSIDGPEKMHDKFRKDASGQGTFGRVMDGLEALKSRGTEFNTLTVVQSDNCQHPEEVYDFLKSIGSNFLQFIPIVEDIGEGEVSERSVTGAQYGEFMSRLFDHWLEEDDVGEIFIQRFDVMLGLVMGYPSSICVHAGACGRAVALEHNGDLYSCDHFVDAEHLLGNIADAKMAELVDGEKQTAFGKSKSEALPMTCRTCEYLRYCYGACIKDRIQVDGGDQVKPNVLCEGYRAFYRHTMPVLEKMAACLRQRRPARDYKVTDADNDGAPIGRNAPCPCGSGLKYKKCCMK